MKERKNYAHAFCFRSLGNLPMRKRVGKLNLLGKFSFFLSELVLWGFRCMRQFVWGSLLCSAWIKAEAKKSCEDGRRKTEICQRDFAESTATLASIKNGKMKGQQFRRDLLLSSAAE
jgi:hypothetical protein